MSPVHFQVEDDLKQRLQVIPWGMRSPVLRRLVEITCDLHEKHGELGLGALLDGKVSFAINPQEHDQSSVKPGDK